MKQFSLEELKCEKGIYALFAFLPMSKAILVPRYGIVQFSSGTYIYVGSGKGKRATSLGWRLQRHFSQKKKSFWHIDYYFKVIPPSIGVVVLTTEKTECELLMYIELKTKASHPILGFGSTDCSNC